MISQLFTPTSRNQPWLNPQPTDIPRVSHRARSFTLLCIEHQSEPVFLRHLAGTIYNAAIAKVIVQHSGEVRYLSPAIAGQLPLTFWREIVQNHPAQFQYFPEEARGDKSVALAAVRRDGMLLQYCTLPLRRCAGVAKNACIRNNKAVAYFHVKLFHNKEFLSSVNRTFDYTSLPLSLRRYAPVVINTCVTGNFDLGAGDPSTPAERSTRVEIDVSNCNGDTHLERPETRLLMRSLESQPELRFSEGNLTDKNRRGVGFSAQQLRGR